ncbi:MAG: hypothetical protein ACYDAR_20645 [Thermomicrobiales bacterium]
MTEQPTYQQGALDLTPRHSHAPAADATSPVEPFTPRDAAKALIRAYVLRGDPIDELKRGLMGQSGADFHAQIGGSIAVDGARKKVRRDQIGVSRVGTEPVSAVFSLTALYKEIQAEAAASAAGTGDDGATDRAVPVDALPVERIGRDPGVLPNRRLPNDFWPEFQAEWAFRERHGLPSVSPSEFVAMRDWSDGITQPVGARWRVDEERPAYPEWESAPDDGDGEEPWEDAPRDDRFTRNGGTVFDARRAKLDATIDVLANKVEQIVTGDGYRAYLRMLARFHTYSANNVALILAQYPDATKIMGYGNKAGTTGWKSLGRHVREGEKGIRIIRPVHRLIEDAAAGESTKVLTGFTTATVFDVSQTEGIPLPQGPTPQDLSQTEAERSLELDVALHQFIDERGVRVVRDHDGVQRGYWHPGKREIGIRADLTGVRALKTLAHETAHMLADHRREQIDMTDAETVAESVAFVLLDHYGIDTSAYSVPYIATWARDPGVVQRNLDTVRTLSHVLLTAFGDHCPPPEDGEGAR